MCGIAGFWHRDGRPAEPDVLAAMCHAIRHRGPDDRGTWIDGAVALGHQRLSIIDLSAAGRQPMATAEGSLQLVFNGEIYNYRELGRELEARGHVFRTRTDTEVILHAWQAWGEDALPRFRGMWAFALWETARRRLVLVRDRPGIKPLYWTQRGQTVGFGSEIKAVLPLLAERRPDHATLASLLLYQLRTDPRRTCFADVQQVAPGTLLRVSDDAIVEHRWHDPDADVPDLAGMSAPAAMRRLLEESVALHLRSDVPVGACLSGGVDSSSLVALAAPQLPYSLHTFSVVYPGTPEDERGFVGAVRAQHPTVVHHEDQPDGSDALSTLQDVVWHFEEPVWGEASYSWWRVMRLVQAHGVKVVVNGQGADELLGGYPYYYPSYLRGLLRRGALGTFGHELMAEARHQAMSPATLLRGLFGPVWPGWLRRAARPFGIGVSWDASALGPALREAAPAVDGAVARRGFWDLETHLRTDFEVTRLPMLLQAEDRFSMAHSIESRVPFLDAPLVAWARTLPATAKLREGMTKVVLREGMADLLPPVVAARADKKGYPTPSRAWFRGPQADAVADRLHDRSLDALGFLDGKVVREKFARFRKGEARMPELWRYLSMQEWGNRFAA
jgi:asparagine synthase (glutamine-hydrolysing)